MVIWISNNLYTTVGIWIADYFGIQMVQNSLLVEWFSGSILERYDHRYSYVLESVIQKWNQYVRIQDDVQKAPIISQPNHSPIKQLWSLNQSKSKMFEFELSMYSDISVIQIPTENTIWVEY